MTKKHVFCVEVELRATPGGRLPEGIDGAWLQVYLGADDLREAIARAEMTLAADGYQVVMVRGGWIADAGYVSEVRRDDHRPGDDDWLTLLAGGTVHYGKL
ncbi:MAG: hypothetical protein ACOY4U_03775, partial [Pseudomonadota bacterium]